MTVAITGSDGFVGKYLLNSLKNREHLTIIPIDLTQGINACNWDEIKDIKADVYIHLANKSFVPDSYSNPYSFYDVNIKSTQGNISFKKLGAYGKQILRTRTIDRTIEN